MRKTQSFDVAFQKAVDDAIKDVDKIYQGGVNMMFNSIIAGKDAPFTVVSHSGTPVDTGFARASWWQNVGSVGSHPSPPVKVAKGQKVASVGLKQLQPFTTKNKVFLANNAEYILALEYGHSAQARNPDGMVRITLAEAPRFWDLARKRIAQGRK
jgi:hypothetical protein